MASRDSVQVRTSRYVQGGETETFKERLGWWERDIISMAPAPTDILMTLPAKYTGRPDKLAFDVYGNAHFAWLVLQYNSIVDINEEFVAGAKIRLPEPSRATLGLMNKRTGGVPAT